MIIRSDGCWLNDILNVFGGLFSTTTFAWLSAPFLRTTIYQKEENGSRGRTKKKTTFQTRKSAIEKKIYKKSDKKNPDGNMQINSKDQKLNEKKGARGDGDKGVAGKAKRAIA